MKTKKMWFLACLFVTLIVPATNADVIYVDDSATGPTHDGTSWCSAFIYLQDGLAVAQDGDTIRVAQGTYTPDQGAGQTPGDRSASFHIVSGAIHEGGYAGCGAPDPDLRNVAVYETVLSGDLTGDDAVVGDQACCITRDAPGCYDLDCEQQVCATSPACCEERWHVVCATNNSCENLSGICNNASNVVFSEETDASTVLDGLTIARGWNDGGYNGAGMHNSGDPIIRNCTFRDNGSVYDAAGLSNYGGNPELIECRFVNNKSYHWDLSEGAAIWSLAGNLTIKECEFVDNAADGYSEANGGAIYLLQSNAMISDSLFLRNGSLGITGGGGAIAISYMNPAPVIKHCRFVGNSAGVLDPFGSSEDVEGGSCGAIDTGLVTNSIFVGNRTGEGFFGNGGAACGGTFQSCTFSGNYAGRFGGALIGSNLVIENSIVWGNTAGTPFMEQVYSSSPETISLNYSCIEGQLDDFTGTGNIDLDPMFVDVDGPDNTLGSLDDNVRTLSGSPVVDAGDNERIPDGLLTDLDDSPRRVDIADAADTGNGDAPLVDMGAYEQTTDCNSNGIPDDLDIANGTSSDPNGNGIPDECEGDCNDNGIEDALEPDCNDNGIPDDCDIAAGVSGDCNNNGELDLCDVASGTSDDCDGDLIPDECTDAIPDCNGNSVPDDCDLSAGTSDDCNADGLPDECVNPRVDCNGNGLVDICETADGVSPDTNDNGLPDECEPQVVYVAPVADGLANGTGWHNAFGDLQDALNLARISDRVEQVWVAAGTYYPDPLREDRAASFRPPTGLVLYGGFAGNESNLTERDYVLNETILSGDLAGNDETYTPTSTCCDVHPAAACDDAPCSTAVCQDFPECCDDEWTHNCAFIAQVLCTQVCTARADNSHHVLFAEDLAGAPFVLDGFTVEGGHADASADHPEGGGIWAEDTAVTMRNCRFERNMALADGGGLYSDGSLMIVHNCVLEKNVAGRDGGGAYLEAGSEVRGCSVVENLACQEGGGLHYGSGAVRDTWFIRNACGERGGGFRVISGTVTLDGCTFLDNLSHWPGGGGSYHNNDTSTIINCRYFGNKAENGGGSYHLAWQDVQIINTVYSGNVAAEPDAAAGESTFAEGGAIAANGGFFGPLPFTIRNSTFTLNQAEIGGAIYTEDVNLASFNSIFWGNLPQQVTGASSTVVYDFCCFENWGSGPGMGTIGDDPEFVDIDGEDNIGGTLDDDLRLSFESPCIDAAQNSALPPDFEDLDSDGDTLEPWPIDLDGKPRQVDSLLIPDTGEGDPPVVDMGAYEFQAENDCNANGVLDVDEIADGTSEDCNENEIPDECDVPICGDGCQMGPEQCDTAGESPGCDIDCTIAICGDGRQNMSAGEECDDGNNTDGDGCSATCTLEFPTIPAVDTWGLGILALLLMVGAKIVARTRSPGGAR